MRDRGDGGPTPRHLRLARPVRDLARAADMYCRGLGLRVLGRFEDHDGFDGVILGAACGAYHLEFTRSLRHPVRPTPTAEDLTVFYFDSESEWRAACDAALAAGFIRVAAFNPYWERSGRTFQDADGYRVVLQLEEWRDRAHGDLVSQEFAERFAMEWVEAWNAHDLERVLSHYEDDFEMSSPIIRSLAGEPSGTLKGKAAVRAYWTKALASLPQLRFELLSALAGVDSVTLCYRGHRGLAAEVFQFGAGGKVSKASAHYGAPPPGRSAS